MSTPSLIINSPYERPRSHWRADGAGKLTQAEGRRTAGYEIIDLRSNTKRVETLDLVNQIRDRVDT